MREPLRIVLGLAPLEEEAIEAALYGGELQVLGSGADGAELIELAAARAPELVLISAGLRGLDGELLERLGALVPRIAGLALDELAYGQLRRLGVDPIVGVPLNLSALRAAPGREHEHVASPVRARSAVTEPAPAPREPAVSGSVVAVLGTRGAPGASELAASFAAWVGRSHDVLLADFDGDGGELALRFGIEAGEGSLLAPLRAVAEGEQNLPGLLPHWVRSPSRGWPAVLPGLTDAQTDLEGQVDPELGARLVELLARSAPLLVCDVGYRLRGGDGSDGAVQLHRAVVRAADAVIAVIGTRPDQLRAGERQLDLLLGDFAVAPQTLRVIVNGQAAVGQPQLEASYAPFLAALARRDLAVDAVLPYDIRARRAARRRALPMALAAPRSGYARAVRALAEALLLPTAPRPAARKRRLSVRSAHGGGQPAAIEEVALPWRG